jgi:hypothetical protein
LRACVISTWSSFAAVGIPCSAGHRPLTFLAISCFAAAYRLQADRLGDLEGWTAGPGFGPHTTALRPGTILGREWNGQMQQVVVLADGFAWNGNTDLSLSKVAFAITGTRAC